MTASTNNKLRYQAQTFIEDDHDRNLLYEALDNYLRDLDINIFVSTLKRILNRPERLRMYDLLRPWIVASHQMSYNMLVPYVSNRQKTIQLNRRKNTSTSFGFSIRGGCEHGIGVYVSEVVDGSIAHKKGLKVGDQIIRINGLVIDEAIHEEVLNIIAKTKSLLVLKVKSVGMIPVQTFEDDGDEKNSVIEELPRITSPTYGTTEAPQFGQRTAYSRRTSVVSIASHVSGLSWVPQNISFAAVPLSPNISDLQDVKIFIDVSKSQKFGCSICNGPVERPGVFIQSVAEGGLAREVGLEPGDQILYANGKKLSDIAFQEAVRFLKSCKRVELRVRKSAGVNFLPTSPVPIDINQPPLANGIDHFNGFNNDIVNDTLELNVNETNPGMNGGLETYSISPTIEDMNIAEKLSPASLKEEIVRDALIDDSDKPAIIPKKLKEENTVLRPILQNRISVISNNNYVPPPPIKIFNGNNDAPPPPLTPKPTLVLFNSNNDAPPPPLTPKPALVLFNSNNDAPPPPLTPKPALVHFNSNNDAPPPPLTPKPALVLFNSKVGSEEDIIKKAMEEKEERKRQLNYVSRLVAKEKEEAVRDLIHSSHNITNDDKSISSEDLARLEGIHQAFLETRNFANHEEDSDSSSSISGDEHVEIRKLPAVIISSEDRKRKSPIFAKTPLSEILNSNQANPQREKQELDIEVDGQRKISGTGPNVGVKKKSVSFVDLTGNEIAGEENPARKASTSSMDSRKLSLVIKPTPHMFVNPPPKTPNSEFVDVPIRPYTPRAPSPTSFHPMSAKSITDSALPQPKPPAFFFPNKSKVTTGNNVSKSAPKPPVRYSFTPKPVKIESKSAPPPPPPMPNSSQGIVKKGSEAKPLLTTQLSVPKNKSKSKEPEPEVKSPVSSFRAARAIFIDQEKQMLLMNSNSKMKNGSIISNGGLKNSSLHHGRKISSIFPDQQQIVIVKKY